MTLQCRIYVTTDGCENRSAAIATALAIGAALETLHRQAVISGHEAVAMTEPADFEEDGIDPELVLPFTGSVLPAIYLNVTCDVAYQDPEASAVRDVLDRFGLRHVLTDPPPESAPSGSAEVP